MNINRRRFLELLSSAALGSGIVYSFPSVIVPKNIAFEDIEEFAFTSYNGSEINKITAEIFPKLIEDFWFNESPFFKYLKSNN